MYKLSEKIDFLAECPLFENIPYEELKLISFTSTEFFFKEGDVIFQEGDEALEAYVIFSGSAAVYKDSLNKDRLILSDLKKNDIFGEYAIISKCPRTAGVMAKSDLTGISINQENFLEILEEFPNVSIRIMEFLVQRLLKLEKKIEGLT